MTPYTSPFAHSLMFHHFHDQPASASQGSLSADEFESLIEYIGPDRILPAKEWMDRALRGTLGVNDLCISFDDNLRCQFDVAYPILRRFGITSFWFVYTCVLDGVAEKTELYRHFRSVHFPSVTAFYENFYDCLRMRHGAAFLDDSFKNFSASNYLAEYSFYSDSDRRFRFLRDLVLGQKGYFLVMDTMLDIANIDRDALLDQLWMNEKSLRDLAADGNVIGLHSHSHPTRMDHLPVDQQREEYERNKVRLEAIVGKISTASHPCGVYSADTIAVLRSLGINLGFRDNMLKPANFNELEFPREDSANLIKRIRG